MAIQQITTNASFTCCRPLLYNFTQGNKSVANDTFQIIPPTFDSNNAIVRIS
jgi:hypothetical protein